MLNLFSGSPSLLHIVWAIAIVLVTSGAAAFFYYVARHFLRRLASKTQTELDNFLIKALEWPVITGGVLIGLYLGVVSLPFLPSWDFEIRRAFHAAYILFGAWTVSSALDAVYRWFKLEITPKTQTALDDWIVAIIRLSTPAVAFATGIIFSLELYGVDMSRARDWLASYGTRIGIVAGLTAIVLFALGVAGTRAINTVVNRGAGGQPDEEIKKRVDTLSSVLTTAGQVFVILVAAFIILSQWINITPILAGASVLGVALGFGSQALVKDLISGFFVVMENQYRVGDVVSVAGISGLVMEISLRRTVLRDMDGTVHVVPNGEIKVASNMTKGYSRVNLDVSVSYDTDLDKATAVLNQTCSEMAAEPQWAPVIIKPPEVLRVEKFGDSGIDLKVMGDVKPTQQWAVSGELRKRIKKAFDREGIEIPYPHTTVIFGNPLPATPGARLGIGPHQSGMVDSSPE
jgi:moderate conductance mechanosensitive channel